MTTQERVQRLVGDLDYPMLIVTATAADLRQGCLVGFSTQCSIEPARFLVCLSKRNATYRIAAAAPVVAVHFLTVHDRELSRLFGGETGDAVDKFARCAWDEGPHGATVLRTGAGYYIGLVLQRHDVGDHVAFLLEPVAAEYRHGVAPQLGFQDVRDLEPGHEA